MTQKFPRIAVRAIIVDAGQVLLVNAWPDGKSDLLCAPGGGVEPGSSMPNNLRREVYEETGLDVLVGAPCLVNEYHDPSTGFHQVEVFFRCEVVGSAKIASNWHDVGEVVTEHHWVTREDLVGLKFKPDALIDIAFSDASEISYDPLETVVR